jgi:hypothetical protein
LTLLSVKPDPIFFLNPKREDSSSNKTVFVLLGFKVNCVYEVICLDLAHLFVRTNGFLFIFNHYGKNYFGITVGFTLLFK